MEKEIRDLLKNGDVKLTDLCVKVLNPSTGKEGWIDVEEIFENLNDSLRGNSAQ